MDYRPLFVPFSIINPYILIKNNTKYLNYYSRIFTNIMSTNDKSIIIHYPNIRRPLPKY